MRGEVPVVEVRVGHDRLPRDLVERDVLRRQVGCGRDHQRVADPLRVADRPAQRLHAAEAAAHHRGELRDAEPVGEPRLRVDPVLDGDHREVAAPRPPGVRVERQGPRGAEAAAEVVHADDEEALRVERLARPDHVVPPADVVLVAGVVPGHVVRRVQRVADEHRVGLVGVERAVRLVRQLEPRQPLPARELQRLGELRELRLDDADGPARRGRGGGGAAGGGGERGHRTARHDVRQGRTRPAPRRVAAAGGRSRVPL